MAPGHTEGTVAAELWFALSRFLIENRFIFLREEVVFCAPITALKLPRHPSLARLRSKNATES